MIIYYQISKKLQILSSPNLSYNTLLSLSKLKGLKELKIPKKYNLDNSIIQQYQENLTNLETLNISSCIKLSDDCIDFLYSFPKIIDLCIIECNFTIEKLIKLYEKGIKLS